MLSITIFMKLKKERFSFQIKSQANISITVLSKVHRIDKGLDPYLRPEKQIEKPLSTSIHHMFPLNQKVNIKQKRSMKRRHRKK